MTLRETKLPGVFEIHLERQPDERVFCSRPSATREFESNGLNPSLVDETASRSDGQLGLTWALVSTTLVP